MLRNEKLEKKDFSTAMEDVTEIKWQDVNNEKKIKAIGKRKRNYHTGYEKQEEMKKVDNVRYRNE